jgi:AcrR family transcriptional regulator
MTSTERADGRRSRLLDAALDLMGNPELGPPTVRKVLSRSGVAPRYFYDYFSDLDDLQRAVFRMLTAEAEQRGTAAMVAAPARTTTRTRAVLAAMVDLLLNDPRKGFVLLVEPLHSPVLGPLFATELRRFAGLLATYSPAVWRGEDPDSRAVLVTTQFALGGFAATMSAALIGQIPADRDRLVDELTVLFLGVGSTFRRLHP